MAREDWFEPIIRDVLANGITPADRLPRLRFALAIHLKEKAAVTALNTGLSERAAPIGKRDVEKLNAEALVLFDRLVADGVSLELIPNLTLAQVAKSSAHEIRNLSVGKKALEIAGEDLDGRPMRLSDYRGKVVVLSFWHSQCGPCLDFARHERKLVERFARRPFAPVGVNVDPDRGKAKTVSEKGKYTWKSFWCGPDGNNGDIPRSWNIQSWPTIYMIDHTGVIRSKNSRGPELDRLLDELVSKAEADAK